MTHSDDKLPQFRMPPVVLATAAVTALFIGKIWEFLIALFLAAIYSRIVRRDVEHLSGHRRWRPHRPEICRRLNYEGVIN